jgi:hypothetical protein
MSMHMTMMTDHPPPNHHGCAHKHNTNLAITKALMPMLHIKPTGAYSTHGYVTPTRVLLKKTYHTSHRVTPPTSYNTLHFIRAIVDDDTGDLLEYCDLIKMTNTERCGNTALPTNSADSFKAYAT